MDSKLEKILALSASAIFTLAATNMISYLLKRTSDPKKQEKIAEMIFDKNVFDYTYSIYFGAGEHIRKVNDKPVRSY